jgi:hypothetical protein
MDQTDKSANDKITKIENEIKVLKNEVQAVLLDLRESYLNMENPFNSVANPATIQPIVITERTANSRPQPEPEIAENHKSDPVKLEGKPLSGSQVQPDTDFEITRREIHTISNANSVQDSTLDKPTALLSTQNGKLDIMSVAGLVSWIEESTQRLGKERSITILEMSEVMGYLSAETKTIAVKLIGLAADSAVDNQSGSKAFLASLVKLNRLLSHGNVEQIAMELLLMGSGDMKHG